MTPFLGRRNLRWTPHSPLLRFARGFKTTMPEARARSRSWSSLRRTASCFSAFSRARCDDCDATRSGVSSLRESASATRLLLRRSFDSTFFRVRFCCAELALLLNAQVPIRSDEPGSEARRELLHQRGSSTLVRPEDHHPAQRVERCDRAILAEAPLREEGEHLTVEREHRASHRGAGVDADDKERLPVLPVPEHLSPPPQRCSRAPYGCA